MAESTHITRRVSRDPAEAMVLAAGWHQGLCVVPGTGQITCGNRLWLQPEPQPSGPDPLGLYAVRGVLWVCGRPVAVTFELSMWSTTEIQVGLRPKRLAWPVGTPGFARKASRALDEIAHVLSGLAVVRPGLGQAAPAAASLRDPVPSAA
jgi:hypothetical protein